MPKVFLTPLLIAGLLLLPSCSSAEAKACEAAQLANKNYYEKAGEFNGEAVLKITPEEESKELLALARGEYSRSQRVIVNNPTCFTPKELVEAQIYLGIK